MRNGLPPRQMKAAFKVRPGMQTKMRRQHRAFGLGHSILQLIFFPNIKRALAALRVGVQRRIKRAAHLAALASHCRRRPVGDSFRRAFQFRRFKSARPVGKQRKQQAVVAKHFFKMGNRPAVINAIAKKSAAQMVLQSARRHFFPKTGGRLPANRRRPPPMPIPNKTSFRKDAGTWARRESRHARGQ